MVMEYCQGCGKRLKEPDGRTHCARCIRVMETDVPHPRQTLATPPLLRRTPMRVRPDKATLPLLGVE